MSSGSYAVERYEFGLGGVAYLRSYLARSAEGGNLLGPLLDRRELEAGSTWAFLPSGSSARAGANFEAGGLLPRGPGRRMPEGTVLVHLETDSVDQAVIEWVAATLASGNPGTAILCVEDTFTRRHHLVRPPSELALPTFLCGNHVYHYACSRQCLAPVVRSARGAYWQPNVGIITKPDIETIPPGQEVSPGMLDGMAGAARAIIVGAWDLEGFLIWEP